MNLSTGTTIPQLPTGTIDSLSAVIPVTVNMTGTPVTIQSSIGQISQFMAQSGNMTGSYISTKGFISEIGAQLTYGTGTFYKVEAGAAEVNGTMLTWSSPINRSGLTLASGTIYYSYLYSSAGFPAVEESTTVPVWDSALNYYKKTGDNTRRCIGFVQASNANTIRKFSNIVIGRMSEIYFTDGVDATAGKRIVSGGTASGTWASFSLASFVPNNATHAWVIGKVAYTASGDDGILGISPIDLGTANAAQQAPYAVRDRGTANGTSTFFGHGFLPLVEVQIMYYRVQTVAGSPTANIEVQGARFIR
jgi:hypothetical protein